MAPITDPKGPPLITDTGMLRVPQAATCPCCNQIMHTHSVYSLGSYTSSWMTAYEAESIPAMRSEDV